MGDGATGGSARVSRYEQADAGETAATNCVGDAAVIILEQQPEHSGVGDSPALPPPAPLTTIGECNAEIDAGVG